MLITSSIIERDNENNIAHERVANWTNDIGYLGPVSLLKMAFCEHNFFNFTVVRPVSFFFFFFFFLVFPVIWFHVCALNADLAANFKTNHCNCACEFFPSNEIMLLSRAILCILIVDRFAPSFIQQPRNWIFFDPGENLDTIPVPVPKNPNELTRVSINLLGNRISHNSNVRVYRRWFDSLSTFQSLLTFGRAWCSMIGYRTLLGEVRDEFQDVNSS